MGRVMSHTEMATVWPGSTMRRRLSDPTGLRIALTSAASTSGRPGTVGGLDHGGLPVGDIDDKAGAAVCELYEHGQARAGRSTGRRISADSYTASAARSTLLAKPASIMGCRPSRMPSMKSRAAPSNPSSQSIGAW